MPTLPGLIARRFIARPDTFAMQGGDGQYSPFREWNRSTKKRDGALVPLTGERIERHLNGTDTIGHYMVNQLGETKLFAMDIDFRDSNEPVWFPMPTPDELAAVADNEEKLDFLTSMHHGNPRELWQQKKHPSRRFYLIQMNNIAEMFTQKIASELDIPCAAAYSGFKGIHVYGWTGLMQAADARALGEAVLESFDRFHRTKGKNFWIDGEKDPHTGYRQFEIELFPKQDSVGHGGFGNLMRLPMGVNRKNPLGKAFFIDQRHDLPGIAPHPDPAALLESGDPWK